MRILVLGATGMLGHKLWQVCSESFETRGTARGAPSSYAHVAFLDPRRLIGGVTAADIESVGRAIAGARPDVVVNCIGVVKQAAAARDPIESISANALFPHLVAGVCARHGARLIHISTDCVFSGRKGNYSEEDPSDAEDLYGRTKLLGEVSGEGCLTLRTSMIGRELESSNGLVEWFLAQEGQTVSGYRHSIFSGFTTLALSRIVRDVVVPKPNLHGVWHVASEPIRKLDLLTLIKEVYRLDVRIEPEETVICDRSLNGERFGRATGFVTPSWKTMIEEMYHDPTPYSELRRQHARG